MKATCICGPCQYKPTSDLSCVCMYHKKAATRLGYPHLPTALKVSRAREIGALIAAGVDCTPEIKKELMALMELSKGRAKCDELRRKLHPLFEQGLSVGVISLQTGYTEAQVTHHRTQWRKATNA